MSLKELCTKNIIEMVKNLPPLLKEEIIKESLKAIKEDARKEVIAEIANSSTIIVDDITERLLSCANLGCTLERPEYTNNIDDKLYYTFVNISERFVDKYSEKLIKNNSNSIYIDSSSDEDY
jgi:hypothetical protein